MCAVASINVTATIRALQASMAHVAFGACKLFTHEIVSPPDSAISVVSIERLTSSSAYSSFLLERLVDHVETSHCLIVQWDGHVLDAARWQPAFLEQDYIGASWPQFSDGHDVGNGGFSLRSRRLMELCRDPEFCALHPEDMAIGRVNRKWLESRGMRFPSRELASLFAVERAGDMDVSFGYHGVFNMPRALGVSDFWDIYCTLDDRATVRHDFSKIARDVIRGSGGLGRATRLTIDHMKYRIGKSGQ